MTDGPDLPRRGLQAARARQGLLPQALHGLAARRRWATITATRSAARKAAGSRAPRLASARSTPASRRPQPLRPAAEARRGRLAGPASGGSPCRRSSSAAAPACAARCASRAPRTPRCRSSRRRCWRAAARPYRNVPALGDVRTMGRLLARLGAGVRGRGQGHRARRHVDDHRARGALRPGQDHARVGAGARAAGRALRPRARVAARRLRDRRAPDRSAPQGAGGDGGAHRAGARLRQRARPAAARRHHRVRHGRPSPAPRT